MRSVIDTDNLTLIAETKGRIPTLPFVDVKESILGKKYNLSIVFPSVKRSTELHIDWKNEDGPANILSFPITQTSGEIFISLEAAKKEHAKFGLDYDDYIGFLLIHGMLHLKGMDHGAIMEKAEAKYCKKFGITFPSEYYGS